MNHHLNTLCRRTFFACLTLSIALPAFAQIATRFEEDFDDVAKPWQEITVQLPPVPEARNLLPFDVSATATQRFAIDATSLSVGSDGVVRYVLVARSESGAENISYEGLRCASLESKLYAFGHRDGTWSRSRRDGWEPIHGSAANRQHAALADGYLCDGHVIAGDAPAILRRLRLKQPTNLQFAR